MRWRYVCGFLFVGDEVALIIKKKPEWQAGRINGIGGKIEEGEMPIEAMAREFKEEAALATVPDEWHHYCTITNHKVSYQVHFFTCTRETKEGVRGLTDEEVVWCKVNNLPPSVIHNLRWLIPLAQDADVPGPVEVEDCGGN